MRFLDGNVQERLGITILELKREIWAPNINPEGITGGVEIACLHEIA